MAAQPDLYRARSASAFDAGAAFGLLCPSCRMTETGGEECSRCRSDGRASKRGPAEPDYLAAADYAGEPNPDFNEGH